MSTDKDKPTIVIEHVSKNEQDNTVLIKGYAYDENENPVKVGIDTKNVEDIDCIVERRPEIALKMTPGKSDEIGFLIRAKMPEIKGKLKLYFLEPETYDEIATEVINLNKRQSHPAERIPKKEVYKGEIKGLLKFLASGTGLRFLNRKLTQKIPNVRDESYYTWIAQNENDLSEEKLNEILDSLEYKPLISILVPIYKVKLEYLKAMIESVKNQYYPNWQLCLADDNSGQEDIIEYLKQEAEDDSRINLVIREENGGISEATNSAFEMAKGEFVALLDDDDILAPNALLENVILINEDPDVDVIYSDEDKINDEGIRSQPFFKPDFSYHTLLTHNYICHFLMFRRSLIGDDEKLLNSKYDGSQDHDLILRLTERTDNIGHITKILYHWRLSDSSTSKALRNKQYALDAGINAVNAALERRGYSGEISVGAINNYVIDFDIQDYKKVSVIIPTKNNPEDLKKCIKSIIAKTDYPDYEIIIADNNNDKKSLEAIEQLVDKFPDIIKVVHIPIPFNYSMINNIAAREATGDYYLFLNDDTQVITKGWMTKMVGYAQLPETGCVGVKLLYPDNTIQHAGIVGGILGLVGQVYNRYPRDLPGYFGMIQMNENFSAVTAACLMVAKDKFWQVGGFDEDIAVSFNDVDLCFKILEAGYFNVYLANVELYHFESKSRGLETTADKIIRFDKEAAKLKRRWRKYIYRDPFYNPNLTPFRGDYSLNI